MAPCRSDWSSAYAKQSESDFSVYKTLCNEELGISVCHRLHYLQMACEKIAKAYRFRDTSTSTEELQTSHVAFSKFIICFLMSHEMKQRYNGKDEQLKRVINSVKKYAREIEKLAPAVDKKNNPCNAEYPWVNDKGTIVIPCEYTYPNYNFLLDPRDNDAMTFLKVVTTAIRDFDEIRIR